MNSPLVSSKPPTTRIWFRLTSSTRIHGRIQDCGIEMNSSLSPGTKLGRYEIRSQLGAGGMGEVYRADDEQLNRDVAVKVLPATLSQDADRLRRFEQQAH